VSNIEVPGTHMRSHEPSPVLQEKKNGLPHAAVSNLGCMASNDWVIDELERISREMVVAYSRHCPRETG
jgi:hypothetical protein